MKIKICGLTRLSDFKVVQRLGADYAGFVFYPGSKRYVTPEQVSAILKDHSGSPQSVAVFADAVMDQVKAIIHQTGIRIVQLHGRLDSHLIANLQGEGVQVIPAFRIRDASSLEALKGMTTHPFLLDAWDESLPGGTGKTFDWNLLKLRPEITERALIAGGLHPENLKQLFNTFIPFGIDLSSGVEVSPGIKDPLKLERLFQTVREHHAKHH